jgi:hypothetical protein
MAPEAAELALETAMRTLSNAISGNGSSAGAARSDSAVSTAISGLQTAAQKYGQVGACVGDIPASCHPSYLLAVWSLTPSHVCLLSWLLTPRLPAVE